MASKHSQALAKQETAVCYADFCDVFRCKGYLKILRQTRKKKMNFRGSFTKIFGSQEALYDLGINVHDEEEFNFFQGKTRETGEKENSEKNAVMTMPPQNVLRALDSANENRFRVGVELEQNVQDPLEFNTEPIHEHNEQNRLGSRPRGTQGPRNSVNDNLEAKKQSFQNELEDIVTKIVKLLEKNIGRKIRFLSNGNNTAENDDANENFEDMEEECEPVSMQETQDKCMRLIQDCISPLLIELADSEYVEMEDLLNRQLCEYLTCQRFEEFAGIPNTNAEQGVRRGIEYYLLMAILTCSLAFVLVVIYLAMWFCFWQMESQGPMGPTLIKSMNPKSTNLRPTQLSSLQLGQNHDWQTQQPQQQQCQNNHSVRK